MSDYWYSEMLAECEADGYRDAKDGAFNLPYYEDEYGCCANHGENAINMAYRRGWNRMRRALMAAGKWE